MAGRILAHPNYVSWDSMREFPLGDDSHLLSWSQREIGPNRRTAQGNVNGDSRIVRLEVVGL